MTDPDIEIVREFISYPHMWDKADAVIALNAFNRLVAKIEVSERVIDSQRQTNAALFKLVDVLGGGGAMTDYKHIDPNSKPKEKETP